MSLHAFGNVQIAKLLMVLYRSQFRFFCVKGGASQIIRIYDLRSDLRIAFLKCVSIISTGGFPNKFKLKVIP